MESHERKWNNVAHKPLIFVLIFYLTGLVLGNYIDLPALSIFIPVAALLILFLWAILRKQKRLGTVLFPVIFVLTGVLLMNPYCYPRLSKNHISNFMEDQGINVEGTLYKPSQPFTNRTRIHLKAEKIYRKDGYTQVVGKVLLTVGETGSILKYGDRIRFICRLKKPNNFNNPGGFEYSKYLALKGIFVVGYLKSSTDIVKISEENGNPIWTIIEEFREKIRDFIDSKPDLPNRGIIKALLLGEKGEISERTRDNFIASGVAHVLAISGLHMGFIALIAFFFIKGGLKCSERMMLAFDINKIAAFITLFPVLFYASVSGFAVSAFRATIMIVSFLISILLNRQRDLYNTLALAAMIITVIFPPSIFDVSFQLSFTAVFSIVYLTPRFLYYLSLIPGIPLQNSPFLVKTIYRYMSLLVLVSMAAALGTAPLVAYYFHRIPAFGVLANLIIVPAVGFLVVPLSLFFGLTIFISSSLASLVLAIDSFIVEILVNVAGQFSRLPGGCLWVNTPTVFEIALFYLLVVFLFNVKRLRIAWPITMVVLLLIGVDYLYWFSIKNFNTSLRVTFLSVGQGDSALIEFPKGKRMIIDGGGFYDEHFDTGRNIIAPFLWNEKIKRVDYLLLSHPHPDHMNGLHFIAKHFKVQEIWTNGQRGETGSYFELMDTIEEKGIKNVTVNGLSPIQYINGVQVAFYNPPVPVSKGQKKISHSSFNNNSVVVQITFKGVSFLFTGDIEEEAERDLLQFGKRLKSTVIKVPHHGSKSSSTEEFLEAVHPLYAVFSVSYGNRFGFPKKEVEERYMALGSKIFRTDRDGAITMVTDGERLEVNGW